MSSEELDTLSNLPEEITSHILSLMPTKFAVRTSILSKGWRFGWTMVTNLDFEDNYPVDSSESFFRRMFHINRDFDDTHPIQGPNTFSKFVDRVLDYCKSSKVKSFRLYVKDRDIPKSSIFNWIDKAVSLNICELDIHALFDKLPLSLLTCKTLTTLRLVPLVPQCSLSESHCQLVNLPCLKTLDIVVFSKPSASAFKLIKGCPILESLSLEVYMCDDEEDYIFNIPTLKQLKLQLISPSRRTVNKVVLRVPNLEYWFVDGTVCPVFVMEDLSSLVEAVIRLCLYELKSINMWVELLKGISRIKSLSARSTFFPYRPGRIISHLPIFTNLRHLDLTGCCHPQLVLEFLKSSPELKHLYAGGEPSMRKLESSDWIKPKSVPACMLRNLTTIKFSEYNGQKADREFLEYMLGNAEVLKMVTITWEKTLLMEEQTRLALAAQVTNFARASMQCEIHFL